jgi:4-amino-4-deoxy-L-arabinose transferase-like glycosyltransferase
VPYRRIAYDRVAIIALIAIGVGIPLWLAAAAGAIGVPTLDDWVYTRAAETLYRTGTVSVAMHSAAFLGQLLLVQPFMWLFGGGPWAFPLFGLLMTAIGIATTYLLARQFLRASSAVLVVVLVIAFPGFGREATSFLTDVPAFTFEMLCLLFGVRWLREGRSRSTLIVAVGMGLAAVSIREFAIAAPVAILIAAWARSRPSDRPWLLVLSFLTAVSGAIIVLGSSLADRVAPGTAEHSLSLVSAAFATSAAVLLPAALVRTSRSLNILSARHLIVAAGVVCIAVAEPMVGNIWTSRGVGEQLLLAGDRGPIFGESAWALFQHVAIFAAILLAALIFVYAERNTTQRSLPNISSYLRRTVRSRQAPLLLFLALHCCELAGYTQFGPVLDRYLYPIIPAAAILLLRGISRPFPYGRSLGFVHGAVLWLVAASFLLTTNSFAFDVARFRAGNGAVALGYDAALVDAGYEWVGYHATGPGRTIPITYGLMWYDDFVPASHPCAVVSNTALTGDTLRLIRVNQFAYRQFLFFGPAEPLFLYGVMVEGCPIPPNAEESAQ